MLGTNEAIRRVLLLALPHRRDERNSMVRRTEPVRELVADALDRVPDRRSPDVIDHVCLAIEADAKLLARYRTLVDSLSRDPVNNAIGSYTRQLVHGTRLKQTKSRSQIMQTYSRLGPPGA